MRWARHKTQDVYTRWECGSYIIVLGTAYELFVHGSHERSFKTLEDAKAYARGMMYSARMPRPVGRPSSPERCAHCGASPAHQTRSTCPATTQP